MRAQHVGSTDPRPMADAEAALARRLLAAMDTLPGLPPEARQAQRAALEAMVADVLPLRGPTGTAAGTRLPWQVTGGLFILVAALLWALAAQRLSSPGLPRQGTSPSGRPAPAASARGGDGPPDAVVSWTGRPRATPPVNPPSPPNAAVQPSGRTTDRSGLPSLVPPRLTPGTPRMTLARATVMAPAKQWEPLQAATALSRLSAGDHTSSDTQVCAERPLPAPPPGAGPWVLGWVLDQGCQPVAEALVALKSDEIELLARTEANGTYALAVEPGIYQAELIVEGPWQARGADGQTVASVEVYPDEDAPRRLDFFIERDER